MVLRGHVACADMRLAIWLCASQTDMWAGDHETKGVTAAARGRASCLTPA